MKSKNTMREMARITRQIEILDETIDKLNEFLTVIVEDDVKSDIGQILFVWDKDKNAVFDAIYPIASPRNNEPPDPEDMKPPPLDVHGMQLRFSQVLKEETLYTTSITIDHVMMIRALEHLKKDLLRQQIKEDKQLTKLIETKKAPN